MKLEEIIKDLQKEMDEDLNLFLEDSINELTEEITAIYDDTKEDLETVTLINDEPKVGEQTFIRKTIDTELNIEVTENKKTKNKKSANIQIDIDMSEEDEIVLESQEVGTGDGINQAILNKFGITNTKNKQGISKWFMNPHHNLLSFELKLNRIKLKGMK